MNAADLDRRHMARALELAAHGQGHVEPNPMVGCVIAKGAEIVGEGWHRRFGEAHAEIEALAVAGAGAKDATLYVTLEPCCHHGKTPPCVDAIIAAGIRRVVAATDDPFPPVAGQGLARLKEAGIQVETGLEGDNALRLNAPYFKRLSLGKPWIIAKWAMTLDGKLATRSGDSRWISSEGARRLTHESRGRVDAIVVGIGSALADDPLLTARPPGARVATRIVLDTFARLPPDGQLARTASLAPVLLAVGSEAPPERLDRLRALGVEVLVCPGNDHAPRLESLLDILVQRGMTNVLFEGGAKVLGTLFDRRLIDEAHVFVAPLALGGEMAPAPVGGQGVEFIKDALRFQDGEWRSIERDQYFVGRVAR